MSRPTAKRRYPGARPFETAESDIFFGRSTATEELYRKILLERVVVLYGKSGDGKSSLLNAGIIPRVIADAARPADADADLPRFVPIKIRFEAWRPGDQKATPVEKAVEQILAVSKETPAFSRLLPEDICLWKAVKIWQITHYQPPTPDRPPSAPDRPPSTVNRPPLTGILLVFDQFEELFTYPQEQYEAFGAQLAELLNILIPMRYVRALESETIPPEQQQFLHTAPLVHVLPAIRSDRLQLLNLLQEHLPNIQKVNYALPPLTLEETEDAVLFPALKAGDFDTPAFDYEAAALRRITDFLTKKGTQAVASFQLQILCESVERKVVEHNLAQVREADIGDPEQLYQNYYRDRIAEIPDPTERASARRLIEDGLIYEEEERRLSLYEGQIHRDFRVSDALLARLVDARLLRAEPSLQGGYTYELSHDTLVRPVAALKKIRKDEERRAAERRQRLRLAGAVGLALLGFGMAGFSGWQYLQAKEATEEAFHANAVTQQALETAKLQRKEAESQKQLAETREQEAKAEKAHAEQESRRAAEALRQMRVAEQRRLATEVNKYLSAAKRMQRLGDLDLAEKILLEAQALDRDNAVVKALLAEIRQKKK